MKTSLLGNRSARQGLATIQSVMLIALGAIVLLGLNNFVSSADGVTGHTSAAVARLFSGGAATGSPGGGPGAGGGIEVVAGTNPPAEGDGASSTDPVAAAKAKTLDRLNELVKKYEQIAANCDAVRGGAIGHSCVLQHQMLQLARQTRDAAAAGDVDTDYDWITGVLEYSLPNITNLGENADWWWDRWKDAADDLRLQVIDAVVTPIDFLRKYPDAQSARDAWRQALDNSLFNWGDVGSLDAGAQHFLKDLYPGFVDGAGKMIDNALANGATESQVRNLIGSINKQHEWLLTTAVPGGFDALVQNGNIGSASGGVAKLTVPTGAKILRNLMWSKVLSERDLTNLYPSD